MARIRTVKPELFLDEDMGKLPGDAVLLFIGLWTLADKEGRLEYRPERIRAALFPYRPVDVAGLLAKLEECSASPRRPGKVMRYESEGQELLWIPGFVQHQRPHPKEAESVLPGPPAWSSRGTTRQAVEGAGCFPSSPAGKGREGKGREGDLIAPPAGAAGSSVAESAASGSEPSGGGGELDLDLQIAPGAAVAAKAVKPRAKKPDASQEASTAPTVAFRRQLTDALDAAFLRATRTRYDWKNTRNYTSKALGSAEKPGAVYRLAEQYGIPEVAGRFELGARESTRTLANGRRKVANLWELEDAWAHLTDAVPVEPDHELTGWRATPGGRAWAEATAELRGRGVEAHREVYALGQLERTILGIICLAERHWQVEVGDEYARHMWAEWGGNWLSEEVGTIEVVITEEAR